jgi:hypothetical protein
MSLVFFLFLFKSSEGGISGSFPSLSSLGSSFSCHPWGECQVLAPLSQVDSFVLEVSCSFPRRKQIRLFDGDHLFILVTSLTGAGTTEPEFTLEPLAISYPMLFITMFKIGNADIRNPRPHHGIMNFQWPLSNN